MPKGYLDEMTHQLVSGWWAPEPGEPPGQRFVRVYLDGVELGTMRANFFRQDLLDQGISDGYSGFKFFFNAAPNPFVDHVVEVKDRDTGKGVIPCPITLPSVLHPPPDSMFAFDPTVVATHIGDARYVDGVWHVGIWLIGQGHLVLDPSVINGTIEKVDVRTEPEEGWIGPHIYRQIAQLELKADPTSTIMYV